MIVKLWCHKLFVFIFVLKRLKILDNTFEYLLTTCFLSLVLLRAIDDVWLLLIKPPLRIREALIRFRYYIKYIQKILFRT